MKSLFVCLLWVMLASCGASASAASASRHFEGTFYRGSGDMDYLAKLDRAARMFYPDPEYQNLSMLYEPKWNGLVEGPTWDAWWIQNSYGTTFSILPFLQKPFTTFLQNSQDLWFDQMGDGKRVGAAPPFDWVAPDGCLCDAARPGWIVYKQGDGRTAIHDWGMEFTAAGIVLQGELLLISRDPDAIARYLPKLERSANFIETRRNPTNDLFLAGPAGNLLAPSYAGWRKPDGSYDKAYLTGLSITYIAALDRLIELEKLAKREAAASLYLSRRDAAKRGLRQLATDEGYFIRSLDPDGVKHGVFGTPAHGYFEASPNHDAIAFGIVGLEQARRIYDKIASIPELRVNDFILPNYPSYDDMYEKPEGLWGYGTWVNGGHWSTCEARAILAYCRLGQYEDVRRSMGRLLSFSDRFRMDNPLTKCGSDVYQPNQPVNLCYDALGPAAAMMRGLFEYNYTARGLELRPHIPASITALEQINPIRLGSKSLLISTSGSGPIIGVKVNGRPWKHFDQASVFFDYDKTPEKAVVKVQLGEQPTPSLRPVRQARRTDTHFVPGVLAAELQPLWQAALALERFAGRARKTGVADSYEAAHARLALQVIKAVFEREKLKQDGQLKPLPPATEAAARQLYIDTARKILSGFEAAVGRCAESGTLRGRTIADCWSRRS